MNFYTSIAPYYDVLFPYDETQITFLESALESVFVGENPEPMVTATARPRFFLDIGCGTGTILLAFRNRFSKVYGLDLDEELLKKAEEKGNFLPENNIVFVNGNMLNLDTLAVETSFDAITCLGNTLPHLTGANQVNYFLSMVYQRLTKDGIFVFQIINYDRILAGAIRGLPTIETQDLTFERYYTEQKPDGIIDFETILSDPAGGRTIRNSVRLKPLQRQEIETGLAFAGFKTYRLFGDYTGAAYTSDSFLLIGICKK